jgi:hypothetical protein
MNPSRHSSVMSEKVATISDVIAGHQSSDSEAIRLGSTEDHWIILGSSAILRIL